VTSGENPDFVTNSDYYSSTCTKKNSIHSMSKSVPRARREKGQSVLVLSALIGLIIIPLIGIFAFEVSRYQHGVQQLQSNCDSAALAGAAMLVTSTHQKPTAQERLLRFNEAKQAAANAFKSTFQRTNSLLNDVLGSTLKTATDVGGGSVFMKPNPGDCTYKVEAVNPGTGQPVDPTDPTAKAIRFTAVFTGKPAFSKFLGLLSNVPLNSHATAGVPVLDVVVCADISGSMDDSTRVSFVNRRFTVPDPWRGVIESAYNDYVAKKNDLLNYEALVNTPGYLKSTCEDKFAIAQSAWQRYKQTRQDVVRDHGKLEWAQVENGSLVDCVYNPPAVDGTTINVMYPQNLDVVNYLKLLGRANPDLPYFNSAERLYQETGVGGPPRDFECGGAPPGIPGYPSNYFRCTCPDFPGGFTDVIAKLDRQILDKPQQPVWGYATPASLVPVRFPTGPFTYTVQRGKYKGQQYAFDGIGYFVEASRGNLEQKRFQDLRTLFQHNIDDGELPSQGKDGYQAAYFELVSFYSQPMASTVSAVENFYEALNGAGADVNFGMVAFETRAGLNPSQTEVPISDIANADPTPYPPAGSVCVANINTGSANPYNPPVGSKQYPILKLPLDKLHDPSELLNDPTDPNKPQLNMNDIFETYLTSLRATNIPKALEVANDMLENSPRRVYARQVVILITDGVATRDKNGVASSPPTSYPSGDSTAFKESRDEAGRANRDGTPIFTIGVGQNVGVENLQVPFLGDMDVSATKGLATLSGNGARFFPVNRNSIIAPSGSQVNAISQAFLQVARSLVQLIE